MRLTDNEIIKVAECCIQAQTKADCFRLGCPAATAGGDNCRIWELTDDDSDDAVLNQIIKELVGVINRQQAEIEGIKTLRSEWKDEAYKLADTQDRLTSENNELRAEIERLKKFKAYFDSLYGTGLEVAFFHQNGELESFDSFYDSATKEMAGVSDG